MHRALRAVSALAAAVAATLAALPAAAQTNLSPSLDQILVPPPAGFSQFQPNGWPAGFFDRTWYASSYGPDVDQASRLLAQDGFIGGYGMEWIDASGQHAIIENVSAFQGHQGALRWLTYAEAADKGDSDYQHANSIAGLGEYFGEHYVFPSHNVLDTFVFLKGNDVFVVGSESTQDDALTTARAQTRAQYDLAPAATIPPSLWPENSAARSGLRKALYSAGGVSDQAALSSARLAPAAIAGSALLAVAGVAALAIARTRRRLTQT